MENLRVHCSSIEGLSVVEENLSAKALRDIRTRVSDANVANESLLYRNLTGADAQLELRRDSVSDELIVIALRNCASSKRVWETSVSLADSSH